MQIDRLSYSDADDACMYDPTEPSETLIKEMWWNRVALWYSKVSMQYILLIYCQYVQKKLNNVPD